jgi:hypothetical protein
MSISVILQYAALAMTLIVGVCIVYVTFEMRRAYMEQRENFARTISAIEQFQKLQTEFSSSLQHIESDGRALQQIALQVEVAVAALNESIGKSISAAAERQVEAIASLRDHLDILEERLAVIIQHIGGDLRAFFRGPQEGAMETRRGFVDQSRLRRETLRENPALRFSVLKDWVSINSLGLLHRAARGWSLVNDLIASIPPHLEPEAELLNDSVILIGTAGHPELLALKLRKLDPSSEYLQWFEPAPERKATVLPAVLVRSDGELKLLAKGTNSVTGLPAA